MIAPRFTTPFSGLVDQEVFAVDERSAQLLVRAQTDTVFVDIDGQHIEAPTTLGVAVIDVADLSPSTDYEAVLSDANGRSLGELSLTTRPSIGPIISRFATISDVHLGAEAFGPSPSIEDHKPGNVEPYALRSGKAAVAEAVGWGAELLVVKGDLTDTGSNSDWELARQLLAGCPIPYLLTPGNHDNWNSRDLDPAEAFERLGASSDPVQHRDLDGVRVVVADTSKPSKGSGTLSPRAAELQAAVRTDTAVFLGIHQNIQRTPIPWFWPPGIPSTDAMPVVDELSALNQRLFISSGHTHRNRAHQIGPKQRVRFTEVSSTADYPGVWAGYEVSQSAIRQTVRRIASSTATSWTEQTRGALGGVWPRWSQGRLADRCVDLGYE